MAKITDPNIIAHSKEIETYPFGRKDIETLAFNVLADLGDEVINKAIEEGKIQIPGLQLLVRNATDIVTDEDKQLLATGKYILQVNGLEGGEYPFTYFPFASGTDLIFLYFYTTNAGLVGYYFNINDINDLESSSYEGIYNDIETELKIGQGGTKLYKHELLIDNFNITIISDNGEEKFGSFSSSTIIGLFAYATSQGAHQTQATINGIKVYIAYNEINYYCLDNNNAIIKVVFSKSGIDRDTVTEL